MPENPTDNRAAAALLQRRVCGAEIATRVTHDNPQLAIVAGDLLMWTRQAGSLTCTGLIREYGPEASTSVGSAYGAQATALYPTPPIPEGPRAA